MYVVSDNSWTPAGKHMKFTIAASALIGIMAFGVFSARGTVSAQQAKSQWDGVYTDEQAKRGAPLYSEHCASCHNEDLSGAEMAPGLRGADFNANWNGSSVGDLFERIRQTMPPESAPGSLTRQQNADIVAYLLSKSGAPAGPSELPTQTELLKGIKFVAEKPAP